MFFGVTRFLFTLLLSYSLDPPFPFPTTASIGVSRFLSVYQWESRKDGETHSHSHSRREREREREICVVVLLLREAVSPSPPFPSPHLPKCSLRRATQRERMTDPIRRDPTEFLRVLKRMANTTSWQKAMTFASKGRMVGYRLTLEHYNTILFSQSLWGRALEIINVVRQMQEDNVQPNGATYYYIVNGMANADHGYNYDFKLNHRLEKLQHWRVALEALEACEANGFDTTDTMHSSVIVTMTIPGFNHWEKALKVLDKIIAEDRQMHPTMVRFLHDCLIRNRRPREASQLMRLAAERGVKGYEDKWEPDVYKGRPLDSEVESMRRNGKTAEERAAATALALNLRGDQHLQPEVLQEMLEEESRMNVEREANAPQPFTAGLHQTEINSAFRPRVYRQLWYQWHQIANKYRPTASLKRRQLAPKDSPTGIPAWNRI